MIPGDFHVALAKIAALVFVPALAGGFLLGLIGRERASRRAAWPGWIYYGGLEIGVLIDKKFPLLWANLTEMVPVLSTPLWLELVIGGLGGVATFLLAGRASRGGYRAAARLLGFQGSANVRPVDRPAPTEPPLPPKPAPAAGEAKKPRRKHER